MNLGFTPSSRIQLSEKDSDVSSRDMSCSFLVDIE